MEKYLLHDWELVTLSQITIVYKIIWVSQRCAIYNISSSIERFAPKYTVRVTGTPSPLS